MGRTFSDRGCSVLFDSNTGAQGALFHESLTDALGSSIQAAGGVKRVSSLLWPSLDSVTAAAKLRACLNHDQPHKLSLDEFAMVLRLARAVGDHGVMQYLAGELGYELKALQPEVAKRKAIKAKKAFYLSELARLEREDE